MIILAFDSGIERTGYALFDKTDGDPELLEYGCLFTDKKDSLQKRIAQLVQDVEKIIKKHSPEVCVLEQLFFNRNITSGIAVAQAQGAIISKIGDYDMQLAFIKPQEIKKSIAGYGNADKKSVQKMVTVLLELDETPQPDDTADAIACGLTYCTMMTFHDRQT